MANNSLHFVIIFSFIGYTTERIAYSAQPVTDIKLSITVQAIEDVVVTGYGTIKRTHLIGAIATVGDIEKLIPCKYPVCFTGVCCRIVIYK